MISRSGMKIVGLSRKCLMRKCIVNQKFICVQSMYNLQLKTGLNTIKEANNNAIVGLPNDVNINKRESAMKTLVVKNEELLEKHLSSLAKDLHQKNRVYKNDLMRIIDKVKELNFSKKQHGLLLMRCCTELLPDESAASRMNLLELIWNALKPHTEFKVEHYNELLRVYIANNRTLTATSFLQKMAPVQPNVTTYELIIKALCEAGDLNQATEVISNMKAMNLPVTDNIFHSLIICQGRVSNFKNVEEILSMMKTLTLDYSVDTCTAVSRALILCKKPQLVSKEMSKAQQLGLQFSEHHIVDILKTLAKDNQLIYMPEVLRYLPRETLSTPSISSYLQSVCTLLVFQNQPMAALEIYKCLPLPSFGPKDDQGLHGRSLVRDCVKASTPSTIIALIAQELMASRRNPIALQNASEAALQLGKIPLALDLFMRMKQMGLPIRPHYFWPILIHSSKMYGEKGVMNALSSMVTMDVKPDYETIVNYVLPYVSFTSPQNLMKRFLDTGLTVSTVLTPMMETLLTTGQVRAASEICELFDGKVDAEKLIKPLTRGYLISLDTKSLVHLLEDTLNKSVDKTRDWVGRFLCTFIKDNKNKADLADFLNIVEMLKNSNLKISASAADFCLSRLPQDGNRKKLQEVKNCLIAITDDRLIDEPDVYQQITHPNHMNEESLKAHLIELEAKGMNTRGVLRKLLQRYCRDGNLPAAKEVLDKCTSEGVFLSAGMKASIFDLHVKLGEIEEAELVLADLNKTSPGFSLDEHKIIDFATLMVYRQKIDRAIDMINEQAKRRRIVGGRNISLNCWRLLDAAAAKGNVEDARRMFELVSARGFCQPTNVMLGPLVRAYLKQDKIQEAVEEFVRLANKYDKTPLKHELLCHIVHKMGEGKEEHFLVTEKANGRLNKLVQTVLNVDKKIHGPGSVQITMIAVFAEAGFKKTLRKIFLDPVVKFHPDALMRRCERFADEKKAQALETIAECAKDIRNIDVVEIYDLALDVYHVNNECKEAVKLWSKMQEVDVIPSQKFIRNLCALLKSNNHPIPSELSLLADKHNELNRLKN